MRDGTLESVVVGKDLLVYKRELYGNADVFVVVLNLGDMTRSVDLTTVFPILTAHVEVVVASLQSPLVAG